MGDIKLGDVITAWDGTPTTVTGVYPQGELPAYRVTMWDGRYVDVCGEHLWKCFAIDNQPHKRWGVRTTLEMLRFISRTNPRVYLPRI